MAAAPEGYSGQVSLGGATFSLAVDAGGFKQQLDGAEAAARQAGQRIGQSLGRGSNASMGLLYLGQTIDDLQYGFRAIVNNIPQVVAAIGGGAGIAGAVGIAAVAVNQLVNHWGELTELVHGNDDLREAADTFERIARATNEASKAVTGSDLPDFLLSVATGGTSDRIRKALGSRGITEGAKAAARQAARNKAEGASAFADVGKVTGNDQQERARMFKDAVEAYGGGAKLTEEYAHRLQNGNPAMDDITARGLAAQTIKEMLGGGQFAPGQFGNAFEKIFSKAAWKADTERLNKAGAENEKATPGLNTDWAKKLTEEGAENERRMMAQLQMERDQLTKQRAAQQDAAASMGSAKQFGSAKDYFSSVTLGGTNTMVRQQVDIAKSMDRKLGEIKDKLSQIGQARFQ